MSLTEKILDRVGASVGWGLIKALTRIARAIEYGIDSDREMHGFPPRFGGEKRADADTTGAPFPDYTGPTDPDGDLLRLDILEQLAREHRVIVTEETDLVALGKRRGWLNEAGEVIMMPTGYGD